VSAQDGAREGDLRAIHRFAREFGRKLAQFVDLAAPGSMNPAVSAPNIVANK
jgi:hypothetical protein